MVKNKKTLINWLIGPIRAVLSEKGINISDYKVNAVQLADAINLVDDKKLTQNIAIHQLLPAIEKQENASVLDLAIAENLLISENGDELGGFIDDVLRKYPQQVEAYKKGKKGVLGLFVGDVMKLAKGKADAKKLNELILEKLK